MTVLGLACSFILALGGGAAAQGGPYLFELLEQQAYRSAWNSMLQFEHKLPPWVQEFSESYNGVTTPSEEEWIAGAEFRYAMVCEPHNCGDNQLHILFAPNAARAWGLLFSEGKIDAWFGEPDEYVQAALTKRAQQ